MWRGLARVVVHRKQAGGPAMEDVLACLQLPMEVTFLGLPADNMLGLSTFRDDSSSSSDVSMPDASTEGSDGLGMLVTSNGPLGGPPTVCAWEYVGVAAFAAAIVLAGVGYRHTRRG